MEPTENSRRDFFKATAAASLGLAIPPTLAKGEEKPPALPAPPAPREPEWRNRQDGMSYRMLGRTGMMVSELLCGAFPFNDPKFHPVLDDQIARGINYIDTAAGYSQGRVESTVGDYLKASGHRERVFLSTKLSGYYGYLESVSKEIQKSLPQSKIDALRKQAGEMIESRGVLKPGYHMNYFGGQEAQLPQAYFRFLLLREHGYKDGWQAQVKARARRLLEESLKRLKTDHVDVLHCPHGISMPEMMEDEPLREMFADFKREGLIRASAVSFHNDVGAHLAKAVEVGFYDVAMFAYNIANHAALESVMSRAKESGMGLIAMKVARLFAMENPPDWRQRKLDLTIPDESLSVFAKAYLWALQNPNLSCCVAQMETPEIVADNVKIIGRKVVLQPV